MSQHTLQHAIEGCEHISLEIDRCVICKKALQYNREHVDTCSRRCFKQLCALQRKEKFRRNRR